MLSALCREGLQTLPGMRHPRLWLRPCLLHLDTVHRVLCRLADEPLEQLKHRLMKTLLEKKALHKYPCWLPFPST